MKHLHRLRLFLWTMRYLTPAQVWFRGQRIMRRHCWQLTGRRAPQPGHWQLAVHTALYTGLPEVTSEGPWTEDVSGAIERARAAATQRFCFLNQCVGFPAQPGWHDPSLSQLWRYHLHYFGYIQDVLVWSATGYMAAAYTTFRMLATSWMECNRALGGDGWHPYTISLRLVNWLHAVSAFASQLKTDADFRQRLLSSLYGQAQVLASNLELDVRGNHVFENLRALIWVGLAFEGAEAQRWLRRALALLRRELAEQVLSDGGHFERNPGYHLVVLQGCLEIALWLRRNSTAPLPWLDNVLHQMLDYLVAILPPDGQMPLLKDTTWHVGSTPHDLLAAGALYFDEPMYKRSEAFGLYPLLLFGLPGWETFRRWPLHHAPRPSLALTASGHYILRHEAQGEYLVLDAGPPCPDYLPAHAHADLLSYELLIDGQRIVVDSGVYEYTAGPWRDYFRSTRAHNTVEVAGENQSEVWSSFRVARRARPWRIVWQPADDHILVQGEHDGYQRLAVPVTHRRTLLWCTSHFWLIVDELFGTGWTAAANHVHLHPALALEAMGEAIWRIQGGHAPLWLTAFGHHSHALTRGQREPWYQGWYSEQFGQLLSNTVLTLYQQAALPICYGYVIARHHPVQVQSVSIIGGHQMTLTHDTHDYTLCLHRQAAPRWQ